MRGLGLMCLVLVFVNAAGAVSPEVWRTSSFKDFAAGDFERVTVQHPGQIALSPSHQLFAHIPESQIWSMVPAPGSSDVYVGTGSRARIYRISATPGSTTGEAKLVADLNGVAVYSMTIGPDGALYAGVSPEGTVYRVAPDGAVTLIGETRQKYIWGMVSNSTGNLVLATGDRGLLMEMTMQGKTKVLAKTDQKHLLSLIKGATDQLYLGTAPDGWVATWQPGQELRVLYDSELNEPKSLYLDPHGNLYAGIIPQVELNINRDSPSAAKDPTGAKKLDSELVRISPDGIVRVLMTTANQAINCLFGREKDILIGTGAEGQLLALGNRDKADILFDLPESDLLVMAPVQTGGFWLGTGNPASVYLMPVGTNLGGEYGSDPLDTKISAQWGTITWRADLPEDGTLEFQTRSGNTEQPDQFWSDWSAPLENGALITSPVGRYLQWRASFGGNARGLGATVHEVECVYQTINQAPVIESLTIDTGDKPSTAAARATKSRTTSTTATTAKNSSTERTIKWKSDDPNNDGLVADLHYRRPEETLWKEIETDLDSDSFDWDTATLPDGKYTLRLRVSDRRSNPPGQALSDQWLEENILVDQTPPTIQNWQQIELSAGRYIGSLEIHDNLSRLVSAELIVDGKEDERVVLMPADGIFDSLMETIRIELEGLTAGEHAITVRASDEQGNMVSESVVVVFP